MYVEVFQNDYLSYFHTSYLCKTNLIRSTILYYSLFDLKLIFKRYMISKLIYKCCMIDLLIVFSYKLLLVFAHISIYFLQLKEITPLLYNSLY